MVHLTFLTGSLKGTTTVVGKDKKLVAIGRAADCDLRFDDDVGREVSGHHAQLVRDDEGWVLLDTASTNGTWVNGERIVKHRLVDGDVVLLGGEHGVEARVDVDEAAVAAAAAGGNRRTLVANTMPGTPLPRAGELEPGLDEVKKRDTGVARVADVTTQKVAHERARAGGRSSGKTMAFFAQALAEVQAATTAKVGKRWQKVVVAVGAIGLVVAAVMGVVILLQQREISRLVSQKQGLDAEIAAVQRQMEGESEPEKLASLESKLAELTGNAQAALGELAQKDVAKAKELEDARLDDVDRAIRRILEKFDAHTYAVPPVFKEALSEEVRKLSSAGNLRSVYARRNRHWPLIVKEFAALGLPEEMAYIAWAETQFDADAVSPAGAKGMWQMTSGTARELGLVVDDKVDERLDVTKQTRAAARKLAALLAEFGSDSFMLALASYNRGEFGVRRALREVAKEKDGFRKEKRDFWHLYRMKKLPEETRDYVPRVLAAAVVCGEPKRYGLE